MPEGLWTLWYYPTDTSLDELGEEGGNYKSRKIAVVRGAALVRKGLAKAFEILDPKTGDSFVAVPFRRNGKLGFKFHHRIHGDAFGGGVSDEEYATPEEIEAYESDYSGSTSSKDPLVQSYLRKEKANHEDRVLANLRPAVKTLKSYGYDAEVEEDLRSLHRDEQTKNPWGTQNLDY